MSTNPKTLGFQVEDTRLIEKQSTLFNTLYSLNVNEKVEKKNGLTYLSWAYAWAEFKKICPNASYQIIKNPETHLPYNNDPKMGIIVETEVTVDGLTLPMWLPVLDSSNRAMKEESYTYQVWDKNKNSYIEKRVEAATSFDINKALLRCLVKNLSMFGLGLYIYAGEDIPEDIFTEKPSEPEPTPAPKATTRRTRTTTPDKYAGIKIALASVMTTDELVNLYQQHKNQVDNDPQIKELFSQRKNELAA